MMSFISVMDFGLRNRLLLSMEVIVESCLRT